ncbi:Coiled-coil domain-containing protein 162 [Triplophysa tibetana]|uniref:Coiled-coil domain-containing protein 162 n=1 Tax=Triplophysa tibetana TaxID=1572043 RepID=A0A5A9NPM2_9TELE|nr:Coiled-coil domain-containing protein 162 [Triplophysa tibetana]
MSRVDQFASSLEQMEAELSSQLHDLRTEIQHNEIWQKTSSKPYSSLFVPKDASYFRLERHQVLNKALKVSSIKPVVSQAEITQLEMESCLNLEYTPESLPLLLHQMQTMLLNSEFEDCVHRARRLAVSREKILTGTESPISAVTQDDVIIYLQWLICHLHSVKTIHSFLNVLHYLPSTEWNEKQASCVVDLTTSACFSGVFVSVSSVPVNSIKIEDFKAQLQFLLTHYNIIYNTDIIKTSADELELYSMVIHMFRTVFKTQEEMKTFLQYDSTEATDRKWGTKSPNAALRKESNWIPHIHLKPKRDPWQQKQMVKLKELRSMDELLQIHNKFLEESDLHKVTDVLKQYSASVYQADDRKPSETPRETSDMWKSIYNTTNMSQVDREKTLIKNEGEIFLEDKDEPVTVGGAFVSLVYLRHLRIRELKRVCLSMLNYLRSVERTLVMDTSGLKLLEGDLVRNMEETGWMTAAGGGHGGPASHHHIYDTPVDHKVRCAEVMEFPEVENLHDYYSTHGLFIHTQDQRGLFIIYDAALEDLEELENSVLLTASRFIQTSRDSNACNGGGLYSYAGMDVDRVAVLLDIWTCEAEFLEHKIQLLNCYLEAYGHVVDPEERLGLAQVITNITHRRPQIDFTAGYFVQAYRDMIVCLQGHKELIRQVLNNQIDEQRQYLERIWRERPNGFACDYGLPPNYIPKHLVSVGGCWPVLKSVYLLEVHPSLCLASRLYEGLEHACAELCEMYRAQTPSQKSNLEKKLLKLALHHWHILGTPGVTHSPQIQRDLFSDVFIEDPVMVRELGLSALRSAEEHQRTQGKEKHLFMVKTFCTLLELVTVRQRIIESAAETELVSRLYKCLAAAMGFDEYHLYMRPVQFEFAKRKEILKQSPVFITALHQDNQNVDSFVPTNMPLAVQELDEKHIGKFSFQSNDGVLQLMNQSSLENLQVVLVCQVVHKNALIGAIKQASVCYWAETFDPSSQFTVQIIQHERSTASEEQRRDLTIRKRLAGAFVSIQLEKTAFRDEMLNAFIKKKEPTGTLKLNSEEVVKMKRKLIIEFCHKFNKHVSQSFVRGQIVALCHSLTSTLAEVPHIREKHFVIGQRNEIRADPLSEENMSPDPRTFKPRPKRLLSSDGNTLINLWFIPHHTEILLMFRDLEEKECHKALQNTLQIISALHDIVCYLVSFARLGNPDTTFNSSSPQRLTADWGGVEGIGAELWDIQRQIDSLCEPRRSEAVGRLLQLHREVLFMCFQTAVRYMIREAFLSSGNISAYQSVSENMSHALPIMSDSVRGGASSVPEPLDPVCLQAQKLYPWRWFLACYGSHPLVVWDVSPIEFYMQVCSALEPLGHGMEANGAILGVSLVIDDVVSSGRSAAPLQLQSTGDDGEVNSHFTSSAHVVKENRIDVGLAVNPDKMEIEERTTMTGDPVRSLENQRGFLLLWKQMEVFKESWTERQLTSERSTCPALHKHISQLYRAEIYFPSMHALAQHMEKEKEYEMILSLDQSVQPPPGATEVDIKTWQLLRLLEVAECDMIRALQRRINTQTTLVMSERSRHDMMLPTELWKKASMEHSFSLERPQIVENFMQQLMNGDEEETDGQVMFAKAHLQGCLTDLASDVMNRERSVFLRYSQFYEQILHQQGHLLYQREQDVKELEAKERQSTDPYIKVAEVCREKMVEITALRARVTQLEEEKRSSDQQLSLKHRQRYDSLVRQLFSTSILLKSRLDQYHVNMEQDVRRLVSGVRTEAVERIIRMKKKLSFTTNDENYRQTLHEKEALEGVHVENGKLTGLLCKLKAFGHWRMVTGQDKLQKEVLHLKQNEVSCQKEALKSKMISEEKVNVLKQELDAVQEMMVQCKSDYERTKRQILQQTQKLEDVEHRWVRDTQSRQELENLRVQSLEQLQEDVLDRDGRVRALSAQLERNNRETELKQQHNHKRIKHVRSQLYQERTLKREAFHQVDKLHSQIHSFEATVPSGRQSSSRILYLRNASAGLLRNNSVTPFTNTSFISKDYTTEELSTDTRTSLERAKTNTSRLRRQDDSEAPLPSLSDGISPPNHSSYQNFRFGHK